MQWKKARTVVVSTDSKKIADIAKKCGAEILFLRDAKFAQDATPKGIVIKDALIKSEEYYQERFNIIVDLDVTAPVRSTKDLDNCLKLFLKSRPKTLFSVVPAHKNPYFNMVEPDVLGALRMCKQLPEEVLCRQDAPQVYEHVASIYVLDPGYIRSCDYLLDGHTEGYDIGQDKSLDIDSEFDFVLVEFLMRRKHETDHE